MAQVFSAMFGSPRVGPRTPSPGNRGKVRDLTFTQVPKFWVFFTKGRDLPSSFADLKAVLGSSRFLPSGSLPGRNRVLFDSTWRCQTHKAASGKRAGEGRVVDSGQFRARRSAILR